MKTSTIRESFIDFFTKKEHIHLQPSPIVQQEDPSLLFVNAGMNPFKDILLGSKPPLHKRIVNSQPCLRVTGKHNDLEEVGVDTYHHTLFEMLGNWSFGDYFKREAITYAWEALTEVYHLPKERLYATVFEGDPEKGLSPDKETFAIWEELLPKSHICYASKEDNFWEIGPTGPLRPLLRATYRPAHRERKERSSSYLSDKPESPTPDRTMEPCLHPIPPKRKWPTRTTPLSSYRYRYGT